MASIRQIQDKRPVPAYHTPADSLNKATKDLKRQDKSSGIDLDMETEDDIA